MKNSHQIKSEVERTLEAFKTDTPPEMDPWFFQHVKNRIENEGRHAETTAASLLNRGLKPALMAGLLVLNILTIVFVSTSTQKQGSDRTTYLSALSSELGLDYSDSYLLESGEEN